MADERAGRLTHYALTTLWMDSPDAASEGREDDAYGCCPSCCAPCRSLADLLRTDDLDAWVLAWPDILPGTAWWDEERGCVDRAWLRRAWSRTDRVACHDGIARAEREVADVLDLLREDSHD